jgi:hypothetical protein
VKFEDSDVKDFAYKLISVNIRHLPDVEIRLQYRIKKRNPKLPKIKWVAINITFLSEHVGDPQHMLTDNLYDPEYMKCRTYARIVFYDSIGAKSIEHNTYTEASFSAQITPEDVMNTLERQTREFILPKLLEFGLPIDKDAWKLS